MKFLLRASVFTFCMVVIFAIPFQTVASADQCASFDFGTGILKIPCFELQGYSYWLDLSLVPNDTAIFFELTNFGSNSDCQDDDIQNGIYRSCNYFPIQKGNIWVYGYNNSTKAMSIPGETRSFNSCTGKRIYYMNDPCDYSDGFAVHNQNGFVICGIYDREKDMYIDYNFIMLPKEMKIGDKWGYSMPNEWALTYTFDSLETITVNAGTFSSALKIRADIVDYEDSSIEGSYTTFLWYAKNIGIVKILRTNVVPSEHQGCLFATSNYPLVELQSAYVNGVSYP